MIIGSCKICNKETKNKPSNIKRGCGKYCSRKCSNLAKIGMKQPFTGKKIIKEKTYIYLGSKKIGVKIFLSSNKYAIIDEPLFEEINKYKWTYAKRNGATRYIKKKMISMHRIIMNCPKNMVVDHINGNKLDNRKENLRICTSRQNTLNSKKRADNTSGYKGVSWDKSRNKYEAYISLNGKKKHLGHFDKLENAAKRYNEYAQKYYKEFARLNSL